MSTQFVNSEKVLNGVVVDEEIQQTYLASYIPWATAFGNNYLLFGNKFFSICISLLLQMCLFVLLPLISPYSSGLPFSLFFKEKRVQASLSKQINTIKVKGNTNGKKLVPE